MWKSATEALVESLRTGDARIRAFRQLQAETAIRFCESIFGHDYASLMTKAAEMALSGERKAQKAGWIRRFCRPNVPKSSIAQRG